MSQQTELEWTQSGAPQSKRFQDIYFNPEQGLEESRFVFLQGCGLPQNWLKKTTFTIAETGFGTGLNFLLTWAAWRSSYRAGQRLHYVSVEQYPLTAQQIRKALDRWPEFSPMLDQLLSQYAVEEPGFHRFHFDQDGVTLSLLIGEVSLVLEELEASVDAWYLDGFAPSKNPQMWSPEVFREIARLSALESRLATFTAAGAVRRGLAEVGFEMRKAPGFGRKRERLLGHFKTQTQKSRIPLWYRWQQSQPNRLGRIMGAGVAGRCIQHAFARRGIAIELTDSNAPAASANPAANVMPRLDQDHGWPSRLLLSAFQYARRHWLSQNLYQPIGAVQLALGPEQAQKYRQTAKRLPATCQFMCHDKLSEISGIKLEHDGLWYPHAGLVDGQQMLSKFGKLYGSDKDLTNPSLFWATGAAAAPKDSGVPLQYFRGRLTALQPTAQSTPLKTTIIADRYLTPALKGKHYLGSTFDRLSTVEDPEDDDQRNLKPLLQFIPQMDSIQAEMASGWTGIRCNLRDWLPVVGPIQNKQRFLQHFGFLRETERWPKDTERLQTHQFALLGLGSRGFTTAPLMAELLASQILNEPWPLERTAALLLHPARFMARDMKRGLL